mgnify:CR=1 FL=1
MLPAAPSRTSTRCAARSKSIEIIEFGYERSTEGTNGAKSEYCVDKHRPSITATLPIGACKKRRPTALPSTASQALQELWLKSLRRTQVGRRRERRAITRHGLRSRMRLFSERAAAIRAVLAVDRASREHARRQRPQGKAATADKGATAPKLRRPRPKSAT